MERPKILLTGSNGKIGRALTDTFSDIWNTFGVDIIDGERTHVADISDWAQIDHAFSMAGEIDYVIHLAAMSSSRALWDEVLRHNIIGTRHVFERSRLANVKKVLFASSWHVVGGYNISNEVEDRNVAIGDPIRPDGDYATSKAFGEALARQYYEQFGMKLICLRIGNLETDNMPYDKQSERIWLSSRDLMQLTEKSLFSDIDFGIYFATSGNTNGFLDISDTIRDLDYEPQDDSFKLLR